MPGIWKYIGGGHTGTLHIPKWQLYGFINVWLGEEMYGQEVDQRKLGERLWKKTVEHVDWIQRMPWIIVDGESR